MKGSYTTIIGMEIHAEVKTSSKMFCGCKNDPFHAPKPNIYTCPVCLGLPGALPVPNKKAIEATITLGLALGCKINMLSKFDRKHYFYPDLPKGYQISQYDIPFCYDGIVQTSEGTVRIRRVHLEEDTAKLMHSTINNEAFDSAQPRPELTSKGEHVTLIDFNRSGVPLIEVVTEPDIHSASQAKEYAKKLRQIIRYLGIAECDMEQGGMRLEANISLRGIRNQESGIRNQELPPYKVELKNINSFRFLGKGIAYEVARQAEILDAGKTPIQETRGYDAEKQITFTQRVKETAEDYRYFPEPDIPPIRVGHTWLSAIQRAMPEPMDGVFSRWQKQYGVLPEYAGQLCEKPEQATWLEGLFQAFDAAGLAVGMCVNFLVHKRIQVNLFSDSYETICNTFQQATQLDDVSDDELNRVVSEVVLQNPKIAAQYTSGKTQVMNFFIGQVMKRMQKKLDAKKVERAVKKIIAQQNHELS